MRLLLITMLLVACTGQSSDEHMNRLEASREIAFEYCDVMRRCGAVDDVPQCARHTTHHLCEFLKNCDFIMSDYRLDNLSLCLADMKFQTCEQVVDGDLPDSCHDASFPDIEHYPSEQR